jgi:hypothetical protein
MLNRYLGRIMGIRWRKIKINNELWEATKNKHIILQIRMRKCRWVGHSQRKSDECLKIALGWNPQGV